MAIVFYVLYKTTGTAATWDSFIDPKLQAHVLSGEKIKGRKRHYLLWALGGILIILALSGPSIHQQDVPAYQVQQGLVVALDLSTSMLTEDSKPNRLQHAKFELADLVQRRSEGQTGLVVFAADAFSVSPLTTEASTITSQVEHLTPDVMPAQGSRVDRAIEVSVQLLQQSGFKKGHILLFTDGIADQKKAEKAAKKAQAAHYAVSVLAFGSNKGGIIPITGGGTLTNAEGEEVLSQLDSSSLKSLVEAGGGIYVESVVGDQDLETFLAYYKLGANTEVADSELQLEHWINGGLFLLFPLIPLFLLLFRKGYLFLFIIIALPQTQPVHAFEWNHLWLNEDQRAKQAFDRGQLVEAEKAFNNEQWKAVSAYRDGNYEHAQALFSKLETADAYYNAGTTLAKMEQYDDAIQAFQKALEKQPEHEDAKYNLEQLKQQENKNQQGKQGNNQPSQSSSEQKDSSQKDKKEKDKQGKDKEQQKQERNKAKPSERNDSGRDDSEEQNEAEADEEQQKNESNKQQEQTSFNKQLLRRIPDDPSGLWRRKFKHQYEQRGQAAEENPW